MLILSSGTAWAQATAQSGTVRDDSGGVLPGVTVTQTDTGFTGTVVTNEAVRQATHAVPTEGRKDDIRRTSDLDQALTDINEVEKGAFYTLSLTGNEPAYFIVVTLTR